MLASAEKRMAASKTKTAVMNGLLTNTQLLDDRAIPFDIDLLEVIQEASTLANHLKQTTTTRMVVPVPLQVISQVRYPRRENGNLDFRFARVAGGIAELVD